MAPKKRAAAKAAQSQKDTLMDNVATSSRQHSSSHLVSGFERVVISAAAKCGCEQAIKPHDIRRNDDVIEIVCSSCHVTFVTLEMADAP